MRCAAFSAVTNRSSNVPLYSSAPLISSFARPLDVTEDDPAAKDTAVQHFYDKLLHIREQLKTEPGKQMAERRHKFVRHFSFG